MNSVAKFLLLSVVIAVIALPILAARDANPQRGLKKALLLVTAFNFLYLFYVHYIYWRLK
jgi:hypothetical protein